MTWYTRVPKDPRKNLEFRRFILKKASADVPLQQALREACRQDVLFYFNAFVYTYDPRPKIKTIPFITYQFQDEAILKIHENILAGQPLLMQKSRDMGASWMSLGVMDYVAQFYKDCQFLMMSREESLVDGPGNPKALFWKIDFIHKNLPAWILDAGADGREGRDITRRKLAISYHATRSHVTGSTTTKASGVGDRATAIFVDELSRYEPLKAKEIMSGIQDVSPCIIWNFTPAPGGGRSHPSYELVKTAEKGYLDTIRMHWSQHPKKNVGLYRYKDNKLEILDKTYHFPSNYEFQMDGIFELHSVWFDGERRRRNNDVAIWEHLEIDYDRSSHLVFDADQIKELQATMCRSPRLEGDLDYDLETAHPVKFVEIVGGPIKLWMPLDAYGRAPDWRYAAGVDVSFGSGSTPSCLSVCNIDNGEKILEFVVSTMRPHQFATKVVAILRWLENRNARPLLCWEMQGPGIEFGSRVVKELHYYDVYWKKNELSISGKTTDTPGLNASNANKRALLGEYQEDLFSKEFVNRSKIALEETLGWVNTENGPAHKNERNKKIDPSGARDNHGDRVIADAICNKMRRLRRPGVVQRQTVLSPNTVAWFLKEEKKRDSAKVLFPDWNRK